MSDFESTYERILEAHQKRKAKPQRQWPGWKTAAQIAAVRQTSNSAARLWLKGNPETVERRQAKLSEGGSLVYEWRVRCFIS